MQRVFVTALVLLTASALFASAPEPAPDPLVLTGEQRQEVAIREAAFRFLVKDAAKDWKETRHVFVADGAAPAVLRRLTDDGFRVVTQEDHHKMQVYFVTERPLWADKDRAQIVVQQDFYNVAISTPLFAHGSSDHARLRLRRRGGHWQVQGIVDNRWEGMVF